MNCRLTGKIQYLQEKQGFIRSHKKIGGKRDIIFFREESEEGIRDRLKLGMNVEFEVYEGDVTNIKGGSIKYWARIIDECKADDHPTSCETIPNVHDVCNSTDINQLDEESINGINCAHTMIIQNLMGEVFKSLFNTQLKISSEKYRNCWQL